MSKAKNIPGYLVTLTVVIAAGYVLSYMFSEYLFQPWTRDGHVRAQIIKITPRVSGPIVELPIHDNQWVQKGDLLFRIDPRTYGLAVEQAEAKLQQAQASELVKQDQATRGNIATNLIALYKALGGGWEVRVGNDFVPADIREQMNERTDWGELLETTVNSPAQPEPNPDLWRSPDW